MAAKVMEQLVVLFESGYLADHRPKVDVQKTRTILMAKSSLEIIFASMGAFFAFIAIRDGNSYSKKVLKTNASAIGIDEKYNVEVDMEEFALALLIPLLALSLCILFSVFLMSAKGLKVAHFLNIVYYGIILCLMGLAYVMSVFILFFEIFKGGKELHYFVMYFLTFGMSIYGTMNYGMWGYWLLDAVMDKGDGAILFSNPLSGSQENLRH